LADAAPTGTCEGSITVEGGFPIEGEYIGGMLQSFSQFFDDIGSSSPSEDEDHQ
jgi:hypothetical protein